MSNPNSRRLWKTAAATIAGAVLAMSFSVAPATAAPLVDGTQKGSITVHKFERPSTPTGLPNNGTSVDTTGLTPLQGIQFSIQQVNTIDLSTNAGWDAAHNLSSVFSPANPSGSITGAGFTLGTSQSQTTDAAGTAAFGNLPVGLYLVTETNYPAGVTPSAPFLVSVPLTDPDNKDNWLYNVHVYPKNSITGAEKTVTDAPDVKLGDQIDFTITGDIPNEAVIDGYKIVDALDAKLTYVGATATLVDGTTITAGTHYNVVFDAASNTVSVVFTPAGLAVLAAHNDTRVQVVVNTTVNTIGEIENEALVYPNLGSFTALPGQPGGPIVTPPVVTKWGEMTLQKVNENGAALAGASFSVFATEADAKAGTNAIALNGQTTFAVAADGTLTISGLRYSDWANGAAVAPGSADYRTYYLVETTAPSGYELLAEPISFLINQASTTVGIDLQVKNIPSNSGFQLPLTGGTGTGVLYAAGALLVVGAGLLLVRSRRSSTNS
ncbi:SpaH/EbpB family LPXTG-anchored major pilin [Paenarthrobacter ilicis]|uniref:Fimbrial isopeptide formation D2 family protein/LPXTG-motif cell wall-anchored protein n=1 Tax=Paenarthrobacter ilicis TaxID=43665 RepID=A0ABX0TJ64_9MICC|nr:SpaH/EbpB family LPXTG-anchored major pilin [Paenarthrobacter ilicis]MBM7794957.1 fimbrial isopeptide formation D2 family protein/LPXTG-motif cell wall-anchored protein [Paenarthrobacter ilicis]NIJ02588.1 fimbrial isopeptide formation D2 family protein/LPXTG-motif cell wall-anchored protein [Paenarthrobacter ilicis]